MKILYLLLFLPVICWGQKKLNLENSGTSIGKGFQYYNDGKFERAIEEYEKVTINDTNYPTAQYEIARSYYKMEAYEDAQRVLTDLIDFDLRFDFKHLIYSLLGSCYDHNNRLEDALKTYEEGIRLFPMQHQLYHNRGLTYERNKMYDKALKDFQQAIQCNFYNAASHYKAGMLAANEGMYVQATLSLSTYLVLEDDKDNVAYVIGVLETIADGTYEEEPTGLVITEGGDNFEELNLIYKNKIALQKNYKVKMTIPSNYGRQLHMILKNVNYEKSSFEFWNHHYLPFLKKVWDEKYFDAFLMLNCLNFDNEYIQAKLKPKKAKIDAFIAWATPVLRQTITRQFMEFEGKEQEVYVEYDPKHFDGYGKVLADGVTPSGNFYYFHPNGSKRLIAHFDETGKPSGTWQFFNMYNGNIEVKVDFDESMQKLTRSEYYFSGELYEVRTIVNDLAEGNVKAYYRDGTLKEDYVLSKGLKEGNYKSYYPNGALEYDLNYVHDVPNGSFKSYHLNGQLAQEFVFKDNKITGELKAYHSNGQLNANYIYNNDGLYDGPYTEYYSTGTISEQGTYKNGKRINEMTEYNTNGTKSNFVTLDENGKENGLSVFYDQNGTKYHEFYFSKGGLTKIVYFDPKGTATELSAKKGKQIDYILNYPNGRLNAKGLIKDDVREGKWNYFDQYGNPASSMTYKNGLVTDTLTRYFSNGQVQSICLYENDVPNGLYLEYNESGILIKEGFYNNGNFDKEWFNYYQDGSIQSESYYVNGSKNGIQKDYAVNGKLVFWEEWDLGRIVRNVFLDTNENVIHEFGEYNGITEYKDPLNNYVLSSGIYKNGNADGDYNWYYPDGKPETTGHFVNSQRSGEWKWYHLNGKLMRVVNYVNGNREGVQKEYYSSGKLQSEVNYVNDESQGPYKHYFENGKVKVSGTYLNGNREGKITYYSPEGEILMIRYYDQDVITKYTYLDKSGNEVAPITIDNQKHTFTSYFKNGKKSNEHTRVNGLIEGTYLSFHENGTKWEEEDYKNGNAHGKHFEYNASGVKINESDYLYGILHGKDISYYDSGKIKSEKTYLMGKLHGKSMEYAPDGKVTSIITYYNDAIISVERF
ncbi:MAG TPA: tetratricopeptide repeat protein [Fluviicola sp.]|nr:tetratricopeptide repeat protein [Fluviicola sp.]